MGPVYLDFIFLQDVVCLRQKSCIVCMNPVTLSPKHRS